MLIRQVDIDWFGGEWNAGGSFRDDGRMESERLRFSRKIHVFGRQGDDCHIGGWHRLQIQPDDFLAVKTDFSLLIRKQFDVFGNGVKCQEDHPIGQIVLDGYRDGGLPVMHNYGAALQDDRR